MSTNEHHWIIYYECTLRAGIGGLYRTQHDTVFAGERCYCIMVMMILGVLFNTVVHVGVGERRDSLSNVICSLFPALNDSSSLY